MIREDFLFSASDPSRSVVPITGKRFVAYASDQREEITQNILNLIAALAIKLCHAFLNEVNGMNFNANTNQGKKKSI